MDALGVALVAGAVAIVALTVRAIVLLRRSGATREDLHAAEEALKWYEQTPGG